MTDIAIYLPSLRGGGAERAMVTLANGMSEKGSKVDLVLASSEGKYLPEVSSSVNIVDLKSAGVMASLPGLVRYLRKEKPRAMLSALNHANVVAVIARMLSGVSTRLVVSERGHVSRPAIEKLSWKAKVVNALMGWAYRKADGILAVSNGVADELAKVLNLPRDHIGVVYNPVFSEMLLQKAKEPIDHPWLQPGEPPVILGVGRLTWEKDFPALIKAFARVRVQIDCRLIILGEGRLRKELELLIEALNLEGSVQLPGFIENPFAWMSRASLFVLSSISEGLPNALIQAMACGTPVVSTNCPSGPDEIIEGGKWGALVPVGNVDALASEMVKALSAEAVSLDVRDRAAYFSVETAVDGYKAMLFPD